MMADDGTTEIPIDTKPVEEKEAAMAALDLPEGVGTLLMVESTGNIQSDNREGRALTTLSSGVLKGAMARNFDELGTVESRSNSGVMATPIASPAVQTGT
jgi:hypothetical protein